MAGDRTGGLLQYVRYEIRKNMLIKHKLHGHVCRVGKKRGERWAIFDTKNGDTHNTAAHTIWRYYDPI